MLKVQQCWFAHVFLLASAHPGMSSQTKEHAGILRDATMTVHVKTRLSYQLSLFAAQIHVWVRSLAQHGLWKTSFIYEWAAGDGWSAYIHCIHCLVPSLPTQLLCCPPLPAPSPAPGALPFPFNPISFLLFLTQQPSFWSSVSFYGHCQLFEARNVFTKQTKTTASALRGFCTYTYVMIHFTLV